MVGWMGMSGMGMVNRIRPLRKVAVPNFVRRHGKKGLARGANGAKLFVVHEEVRFVMAGVEERQFRRSANVSAVIIFEIAGLLRHSKLSRIEIAVAVKLVTATMKFVGSFFGRGHNHGRGGRAVLDIEIGRPR